MRFGCIPVSAQPATGRGNATGARDRCFLRDYPMLGEEVRPRLCSSSAQEAAKSDIWHLDEVAVTIAGKKYWLWRAVDQEGYVLDEIVQNHRNTKAARRLLMRLLKKQGVVPKRMITDKLRSYAAAKRQIMPTLEHRSHKGLNNRAENSHLPLRKRERVMQAFRSSGSLQRFLPAFSAIRNLFVPPGQNAPPLQSTSIA